MKVAYLLFTIVGPRTRTKPCHLPVVKDELIGSGVSQGFGGRGRPQIGPLDLDARCLEIGVAVEWVLARLIKGGGKGKLLQGIQHEMAAKTTRKLEHSTFMLDRPPLARARRRAGQ